MSSNYIAIAFLFAFLIHTTLWHLGSSKKSYGFAPLILEHPRDTWANPNDTITLVCKADGNPSPTFTWFKNNEPYHHYHGNNAPFSQADKEKLSSAWLRFDQLLSENEGAYHCEASNIHGRAKSTSALLRLRDTSSKKATKGIHVDDKGQYLSNKIIVSANTIAKHNQKYSDDKFTPPTVITVSEGETIELACPLMAIINGSTNTNYNYATMKGTKSGLILQWWHKKLVGEKQSNTYQSSETVETQESVTDMNDWLIITPRHDFYNKNGMLDQPDYNKLPYPFDASNKNNELNNHVITLTSNGKLKFVSITANNAGMYKCVITSNKATIDLERGKGRHGHIHAQPDSILFQGAAADATKLNNDDLANVPLPIVSSLTNLIVFTKPQIIHPPADVTVLEGEDAEFECEVTGVPDPTVVWSRKSGASGYQLSIPYERAAITEGRKSLRISRVQSADAGTYVCEVRNRAGVVKAPAHLAVHVRPTFVVPPRDVSVLPGATATFDCVTTGNPTPSVYWTRESSQVLWFPGRPHGRFSVGLDGELRVTDVTSFDQGYYVCSALSVAGSSIAKAYLEVISSSSSNTKIIDDTIKQAGSQDKAQEEGIETPFDNDFNTRYKGENGQNLTDSIENLTYLTARDNVARRNVRVRPLPYHPPIITRGPVNQTLPPHTDALQPCVVLGKHKIRNNPNLKPGEYKSGNKDITHYRKMKFEASEPNVTWFKGDAEIVKSSARYKILPDGSLQILDLRIEDSNIYTCYVTTTIHGPPIIKPKTAQTSLTLATSWSGALWVKPNSPVLDGTLQAINNNNNVEYNRIPEAYTLPGIPGKPELLTMIHGAKGPMAVTQNTISIVWRAVSENEKGSSQILGYMIEYFTPADAESGWVVAARRQQGRRVHVTTDLKSGTTNHVTVNVSQLLSGTGYAFLVRAENAYGLGPPSPVSDLIYTLDSPFILDNDVNQKSENHEELSRARYILDQPNIILLKGLQPLSSTAIKLEWEVSKSQQNNLAYIQGFYIKYRLIRPKTLSITDNPQSQQSQTGQQTRLPFQTITLMDNTLHNFVVDNLRPWAPYEFVIAPFYDAIEGWNTPPQLAWTLEDAPSGPPLSFSGQVVNNSHDNNDIEIASDPNTAKSPLIFVKWRRPYFSRQNGRLRGYRLQAFYIANPSSSYSSHNNNDKNQAGNELLSLDKTQKSKLDILIREEPFVSLERVVNTSTMSIVLDPMELFQHGYIKVNGSISNMETYGKSGKGGEGLENTMIKNDGIIRIRVAAFTNQGVGPYTTPIDFAFKPVSSNRDISFTNGNLNENNNNNKKFPYTLTLMAGYVKAHDPNLENHQKMRDDDDNINDPYYLDNNNEYYYNPAEYSGPHNIDDNMDYESKRFPIMTRKLNAFSHLSARWLIGLGVGLGWIGILTLILLTYRKFVGLSQQHTSLMHKRSGTDNFCTYLIHTWSGYCCISKSLGKKTNVSTTVGHMQQRQSKHVYDPSNMVKRTYHAPMGNNNDEHKGSSPSPSYCYWNWKNEKSSTTNGKVTTSVVMIPCSNGTQIDDSLSSSNGGQTNLSPPPCQIYTNKHNNIISTMEQSTPTKVMDHSENLLIDDMPDVCHAAANNTNKSNTNNIQYAFVADNNYNCDNQDPFTLKRCSDRKLNEKIAAAAAQNNTNNNPKNNGQNLTLSLGRNQKAEPEYRDGRNNYQDEYGLQDSLHIQQLQHRQQPNHYYYFHTLSGGHHANLDTAKNMVIPMIPPPPPTQTLTHTQPLYPNHNTNLGPGMNNTHNTNINNVYFSAQDNNHESINHSHQPAGIFHKLWVMFDKRKRNKRDNERKEYGFGRSAVNLTAQNEVALNLYWQQALLAQQRHPTNNPSDPSHLVRGPGYYVTATPYDKNAMGNVNFMPNVVGFDRDGKPCYKSLEAPETAINFNNKLSCMIPNVPPASAYYYPLPPLQQEIDGNYHIQRQANGSTLSNPYYRPYSALLCYNNANVKDYPSWAATAQYHNYMDINDLHMVNATRGNSQRKRQQMTMPPTNHDRGAQTNQPTETESDDNDAHLATTSFDEIHSSGSDSPPVLQPDSNISQGNNTTNTTTPFLYQYYYYDDKRGTNNTGGTYYPTNPACPGIWVPPPCIPPPPPPASTLPPVPGNNIRMPVDVNNNKNKNSGKKSVANSKGMNSKLTNKVKRKKNDGNISANDSTSKKISNDNNNNLILLDIDDNHNSNTTQNNTNDTDNLFLGNLVASSSKLNENNIFNQTIINHHKNFDLIDESMNSVNNKNIGRSKQNNPLQPPIYETPQQLMAIGERSKLY